MTHNAKPGSITAFSTVVIEVVGTDGQRGARLLVQAEEKTRKMLVAFVRYLQARRRYQITVRALANAGDRELADVGITRPDIRRIAWETARNCA